MYKNDKSIYCLSAPDTSDMNIPSCQNIRCWTTFDAYRFFVPAVSLSTDILELSVHLLYEKGFLWMKNS